MLDIGCGNHSPSQTKAWFPLCVYHGVDKIEYNNNASDMESMEEFYSIDLVKEKIDVIPDNFFHVVIISHVIEHLPNGLAVIRDLCDKIVPGGLIYIEFPSVRSLAFPAAKHGVLHFCDDDSHVKLYDIKEIANVLLAEKFKIRKAGARRDKAGLLLLPFILLIKWMRGENLTGFGLWDLFGFAQYVYAEKRKCFNGNFYPAVNEMLQFAVPFRSSVS